MKQKFKWLLALVAMVASINLWGGSLEINKDNFTAPNSGSGYAAYNGTRTISDIDITSNKAMVNSNKLQFQKAGDSYLFNATEMPGNITKITLSDASNFTIYVGTSSHPTSITATSGIAITGSYKYFTVNGSSSATASTATITIEYSAAKIDVTLSRNGVTEIKSQQTSPYTLPTNEEDACDGWEFKGWSNGEVSSTTSAPTFVTQATATGMYYAVYGKTEGGAVVTFTPGTTTSGYFTISSGENYASGTGSKINAVAASNADSYLFTQISDNQYSIKLGDNYITYSSSTNLGTSTTPYSWTISEGTNGDWRVVSETEGRALIYRAGSTNQFGGYSTSNVTATSTEYYDVSIGGGSGGTTTYTTSPDCGPATVTATVLANPTSAGSVSAVDEDGNTVTSETELDPEQIIIVTATESNDDYYFYNWTKATGDDATIDDASAKETMVTMGEKNATITANFFPWANLAVDPTSNDLELPLASAVGSFEVTVTSDQNVTFDNNLEAIVTTGDGEKVTILAEITSSTANSATYEVQYEFTAADDYVATIEFTGKDSRGKDANSTTLTINASVKNIEPLDAPEVTAEKTAKSVTLTWGDVANAQGYTVAWNGGEAESATSGWTKEGLTAGTEYTYVVTAVGDGTTYLSNSTEGKVTTTAKKAVGIKDPVFVKEGGKYIVGETLSKDDFTVTQVYNDDTEESGKAVTYAYVDNKDEEAYVFTEDDATAGSKTIKLKFSTYEIEKEVTVESFPKYTVKFSVPSCITAVPDAQVNQGSALDLTGIVAGNPQYLEGYSFAGWSTESIAEGSTSGKLITSYTPTADNTTLYAVYKYDMQQGTEGWSETDLASLATTDVIMITSTDNGALYGIDNTATETPLAVAVAMSGSAIAGTQDAKLKWTVTGDATNGYTFHVVGAETDSWLYSNTTASKSSNTNIRVGSPTSGTNRNKWIVENGTSGVTYLKTTDSYSARYLSMASGQNGLDWRGYLNTDNGNPNIKYYKYQAGGDVYKYTSTIDCSEPHTVSVPQDVTGGTVSASPTSAKVGATITVTYAPTQDYTVGTLTWTAEGGEPNDLEPIYGTTEYTFTMPDANVTIDATFEEIEHVNISWVIDGGEPQVVSTVKGAQVVPPTVTETCNPSIKFMGWTSSSTITSKPADLFNDADAPLATEEKTYYSVYAQESEGLQPADDAFYTLTFSRLGSETDNYSSYTAAHEYTDNSGYKWSIFGNQSLEGNKLRMGGKTTTATDRTMTGKSQIPSKVAKVTLNHNGMFGSQSPTINSIKLEIADNESFTGAIVKEITSPDFSQAGAIDFLPETGTVWAANSYYRFTLNYTAAEANNEGIEIYNFAFYSNGGTEYSGYSTTCQAPVTIADPTFDVPSGKYTETQHVEINCETAGVTIYYTLDGSNPKDSETKQTYSTAVEIEEPGATLKAIATDGADHWSNVVTATYDVDKGYVTSIAEFIARDPKDPYGLKWTDANSAYITGIKSESGDKVSLFVQDASAGIIISNITLPEGAAVGKKMVGTISGKHSFYNFQDQLTGADITNIVFSDATRPAATDVTALDADAYAANPMKLVKLTNVKFQSTTVAASNTVKDASENEYIIYNTLGMMTGKVLPDADVTCDVTGILVKFGYNTDNITYELLPVLVTDIDTKGAIAAAPNFNPAGAETLVAAEVAEGGEVTITAAANCKVNYGTEVGKTSVKAYLTNKEGEGVTVTSTRDFYANNVVTRYFKADPKSIKFAINGLDTDDKGNKVQAKVDDEFVTNTYEGAEVTLIFTPATHYTTTSATLDDEPLTITENQATFTMKGQEVTIATIFTEDAKATATFAAGGATSGSVESITKYLGEKFNLPFNGFTYDNHKFLGWKLSDDETLYQPGTEITMVEGGFAYTAQWQEKPNFANYDWKLVESSSDIAVGNYYVIASNANGAVAGEISSNIMSKIDAAFSSDKAYLTLPEGVVILSLESAGNGNWYLINADTDKKLGATAEKKLAWDGGTMTWSIAMGDNDALTITNGTSSYGTLRYNSGSPRFTTYTSTTMDLPQFYMAVPKVYKITYNVNGGDDASKPEDTYANEQSKANVTAAVPTYTAHKFIGWKDASSNNYVAGQEVTLTADLELLAQWQEVSQHTLIYDANGGTLKPGKSAIEPTQVYEAVKFNVAENVYTIEGYVFDGWKYNNTIYNPGDEFEMPNGDVTFVAQWRNESDSKWHLVTNEAMLTDGSKIMIAAVNANQALGEILSGKSYCDQVNATKAVDADHFDDNKLLISENSPVAFTLVKNEDGSFALKNGTNYLSAQTSGNNIKYSTTIDAMSSWTISIDENAVATIETTGEAEKPYIQHNATATRFSCYGSTTQGAIAIYKEIDGNKAVREVSAETYTTFCIPQGVKVGNFYGATFWNIADKTFMTGDQRLYSITIEQEEGNLGAGVPYIMLPDAETTKFVYYATGEEESAGTNNGLVGVFDLTMFSSVESDEEAIERGIYIISDGTLYLCGNNCGVNAYRAYIQRDQINYVAPSGAPRRAIGRPNVAPTILENVFGNQPAGKAQKVFIDGQIYIIRDTKVFNAQGQLAK